VRYSYCDSENKPMSLKEYIKDMENTEPKGHMEKHTGDTVSKSHIAPPWHAVSSGGHTVHAGLKVPKWQVGPSEPKEQAGPSMPKKKGPSAPKNQKPQAPKKQKPQAPKKEEPPVELQESIEHIDCIPGTLEITIKSRINLDVPLQVTSSFKISVSPDTK
jgi:hypothetical protein